MKKILPVFMGIKIGADSQKWRTSGGEPGSNPGFCFYLGFTQLITYADFFLELL